MTTEEIYNGNVEIAKMLGWVETTLQDKLDWVTRSLSCEEPVLKHSTMFPTLIFEDDIYDEGYHKDWEKLINAVEFIENMNYSVKICLFSCLIQTQKQNLDNERKYVSRSHSSNKKQAVFIAVSQFAKMYNNKLV